ncbi:MAG: excinuclease ABC subunit UvrB [Candidatus Dadabacteria bacterium]|nr:MAG: excinuclease ABC subunit UvrB [Candidatus Dadabacteria bacterium]
MLKNCGKTFSEKRKLSPEKFKLEAPFSPSGDQPEAIKQLNENLNKGIKYQTLLGVTGSGKTFTLANVIAKQNRPVLVIAPNKTLAAQLYSEFKEFFPHNRVRFFISYYDYYQPEAYLPATDTYIEKDASINEEIDKLRHSATRAILETRAVIVVASVSCIYALGAPQDYFNNMLYLEKGDKVSRDEIIFKLASLQYKKTDVEFVRGTFRVRGDTIDIFPSDEDKKGVRIITFAGEVEEIIEIDAISGAELSLLNSCAVYPLSHFLTAGEALQNALVSIKKELNEWLPELRNRRKILEAERLKQRTLYDLELLKETGVCPGIENYSRHFDGRPPGAPPTTLLNYFPEDYLVIIDESHVTVPQLRGMYVGDRSRKDTLIEHGFRLPSARDNRPLTLEEFLERTNQIIFVSATPAEFELELSGGLVVEQINRPTGLLDPVVEVRPAKTQVKDVMQEIVKVINRGERALVLTLTKKMAERLSEFFRENQIRCKYLHSDINAIERVEILKGLKRGEFDVLIGINLLREGLDLVEVSLVAILDADKEGFLRSTRSLIQIMGRAARNINGKAILYADRVTKSIKEAVEETERRRKIQAEFNKKHGIIPKSTPSRKQVSLYEEAEELESSGLALPEDPKELEKLLLKLTKEMYRAAAAREFEKAANLRDTIEKIKKLLLS